MPASWQRAASDDFPHVLGPGMGGPVVARIQNLLRITPTGVYDANTMDAVAALQESVGLEQTGIVDAVTWNRIMAQ